MTGQLNTRQKLLRGVICGLVGGILALAFWGMGWLNTWEAKSWDWRVSLLASPGKATDDIRLILLDQDSLDWAERVNGWSWPWPRQVYGELIKFCRESKVKALAFDVVFTEFSKYGVEDDKMFGAAIAEFPNFAQASSLEYKAGDSEIGVIMKATPETFPKPGGLVTFTVQVNNPSSADSSITINELKDSLTDSIDGNLDGQGNCAVPQKLKPGGSYACSFTANVVGDPGDVRTNFVEVIGENDDNSLVSDSNVVTVTITSGLPTPSPAPPGWFAISGLDTWLNTFEAKKKITLSKAEIPIREIVQTADIFSNVKVKSDPDGVYRQFTLFNLFKNKIFPTLGLGIYWAAHRDIQMTIEPGKFTVGDTSIPIDQDGRAVLRYRGPTGTHTNYKAARVLQAAIRRLNSEDPTDSDTIMFNDLKDKYVLFGFSATGLKDLRPAPVGGDYNGVEINATVLDNLLSGDFIAKVPPWLNVTWILVLTLTYGILASYFSDPLKNLLIGLVFLALPILFSLGLYLLGFWLPLVAQETAVISTVILSLVVNYAFEGRQKRFIKDAFKHYLSPKVIEQLMQHPEQLNLGGERRTLSIFFSDIQGFTTISERLKPEELTALLNDYLSAMTDLIQEEQGTVDKYEGDAIIAFWNAPLNVPDHAVRVVRAALRCQHKLAELRPEFHERMGKDMFMRIGINTGPAVVGNMGSHTRFDYTMLGDAVNLAARLEGVNKQFGTYTMISQSTLDLLDNAFAVRELARVAVVGRKEPVTVYEPMFHEEYEAKREVLETFVRGLYQFYDGHFREALDVFSSIQDQDPPAEAYVEKCQKLIDSPPESWQGVLVMTSK